MDRRAFLGSAAAAALSRLPIGAQQGATSKRLPNVVYLLFDKCRTDAIGAYGERDVHTPNIDALAADGVRFANCYTPQALCGPARASILTGLYPHAHGVTKNVYPTPTSRFDFNQTQFNDGVADPFRDKRFQLWNNFPYFLSAAGYATCHIGKWHLGPGNPGFFDTFKSFNSQLPHWIGEPHQSPYRPDVHTDLAIDFVREHKDRPFFLYLSHYPPHAPDDPPKEYLKHYDGWEHAGYYGAVSNLDWNVGRVVAALREQGVLDDTLIILGTEHGRSFGPRPGSTEGMCTAYEESARIPLIMRFPQALPRGLVWESGVSLVDVMPTILDATGVSGPSALNMQGRSLLARIRAGRDEWDQPIVVENVPQRAIDDSFYKERAIRNERFKLIARNFVVRPNFRPGELYDLREDPAETKNLYSSRPEVVKELAGQLADWGHRNDDSLAVALGRHALEGRNNE